MDGATGFVADIDGVNRSVDEDVLLTLTPILSNATIPHMISNTAMAADKIQLRSKRPYMRAMKQISDGTIHIINVIKDTSFTPSQKFSVETCWDGLLLVIRHQQQIVGY